MQENYVNVVELVNNVMDYQVLWSSKSVSLCTIST